MSNIMTFNNVRIKAARIMHGLSLQELANLIDNKITKQTLHKYETGSLIPDQEMINLLSTTLKVRVNFFYRTPKIDLGAISFRAMSDLSAKEKGVLTEKTKDILERYLEIEQVLHIDDSFSNPISEEEINNGEEVEMAVEKVKCAWNIGQGLIGNAVELLERNNIKVVEVEVGDRFDGCQTVVNENTPVIVLNNNRLKSPDRKRFTLMHELGHLLLSFNPILTKIEQERLCNRFAGAMLLHRDVAIKEFGSSRKNISLYELGMVKQQYGMSMQAIAYRLKDLGIISAGYFNQFMNFMTISKMRIEEPYRYEGREISGRFTQLVYRAISENLISFEIASELANMSILELQQGFRS
jgi:Zn-dependent peptidase ImmA (M78 family)/DNA-binding XRE family transcriptional regulator